MPGLVPTVSVSLYLSRTILVPVEVAVKVNLKY